MQLAHPTSDAALLAVEVSRRFSTAALHNHCYRSYFLAADYGERHGIGYDDELLFVAAMLHDLGLSDAFDAHRLPFESAGGNVAWVFAAGAGWAPARRDAVARAIVDHVSDDTDPAGDPEGHLLVVATSFDISGARPDAWSEEFKAGLVLAHPELGLGAEFTACYRDQAARKPEGAAAASVRSGIAERIAAHPWRTPR